MHVYFSGIGGVGIGPLAMLAQDGGYAVSGSDQQESTITKELADRNITIGIGQDGTHIAEVHNNKPIDWLVYSSAIAEESPELSFANQQGIRVSKRSDFLNHFLEEKNLQLVAVAGTHGKTTTSSMIVWLCQQFGLPISYSVGTTLSFGPSAQYENGSRYFVYECDEFDKNFLNFHPFISAVTTVDYDHPDTYPTQSDYLQAFRMFANQSQSVVTWQQIAELLGVGQKERVTVLNQADPAILNIELTGLHSRQNGFIAAHVAHVLLPQQDVFTFTGLLKAFPGTARRFEELKDGLYTDYAHHPVEIAATIEMAREQNRNVVVVYQPHQNVRQYEILKEGTYRHCFDGVKQLYWLPTYLSRENKDLGIISATELLNSVNPEVPVKYAEMNDALWQQINAHTGRGDLVVAMSAGDLDTWLRSKVK